MSAFDGSDRRQVVPRWRRWRQTVFSGELAMPGEIANLNYDNYLRNSYVDWEESQTEGRAADYLSAAYLYRDSSDRTMRVADFVLNNRPETLVGELAGRVRGLSEGDFSAHDPAVYSEPRLAIRALKDILASNPKNSVRWVDLAREYTILGHGEHASRCMRVALQLAPDNRFVLRTATALAVHQNKLDEAVALLRASPATAHDPWLSAALVATSDLADSRVVNHRQASALVASQKFSPEQTSELSAAMGTAEISAGSSRKGRKLLRESLVAANENTYAQVEWVSDRLSVNLMVEPLEYAVARAHEASAIRYAYRLEWRAALLATRQWLLDQPFSVAAANFGAWCACEIEDWKNAILFAERGLLANPTDSMLINNLAFAQASSGDFASAVKLLTKARNLSADLPSRASLQATEGFVLFRHGYYVEGRARYKSAVDMFVRQDNDRNAARAAIYHAREEALAGSPEAPKVLVRAQQLAQETGAPDVLVLMKRVTEMLHPSGYGAEIRRALVKPRDAAEPLLDIPSYVK